MCDSPGVLDAVRRFAPRIASVHLNDRRVPTRHWCDRVLPGDGGGDVGGVLEALVAGGYRGWCELEIASDDGRVANDFPDSLWKLDPADLVRAGRERFLRLWPGSPTG
jgi:sugar phosphate isomerase/epimerase